MGTNLRKLTVSALMAGMSATLVVAPPAEANRGTTTTTTGYVPPRPEVPEERPIDTPVVAPTVVAVELPAVVDPGAGLAGGGPSLEEVAPQPADVQSNDQGGAPVDNEGVFGGILSRTGAETLPLARAGLGALTLGIGLVVLARRRRADAASA